MISLLVLYSSRLYRPHHGRARPPFSFFLALPPCRAVRSSRFFCLPQHPSASPERGVLLRSPSLVVGSDDPPMIGRCGRRSAAVRASRAERFSRAEARTRGETPDPPNYESRPDSDSSSTIERNISRSPRNLGEKRKKREPADVSLREEEREVSPARDSSSPPVGVTPYWGLAAAPICGIKPRLAARYGNTGLSACNNTASGGPSSRKRRRGPPRESIFVEAAFCRSGN